MSRAILVTGATGKQGGAVIAALFAHKPSFQMLALTRDSSSASAQRLASKSPDITLVECNLDDARSVFETAKKATSVPIWGVFSVQVCLFFFLLSTTPANRFLTLFFFLLLLLLLRSHPP